MTAIKNKIKVGDTIEVEQAWEDESGQYHDEFAEVISIEGDFMKLKFPTKEVNDFLDGAEYRLDQYQNCIVTR